MVHREERAAAADRVDAMVERLADLVSHESPSNDPALLAACANVLTGWGDAALGRFATRVVRDGWPHVL